MDAQIVFVKPDGAPHDWDHTALWQAAERLPGVKLVRDAAGEEAQIFDVATSGHTLVYDPQGRLLFSGGITAGRGHYGANSASDTLIALLGGAVADSSVTQVFGCPLNNMSNCEAKP